MTGPLAAVLRGLADLEGRIRAAVADRRAGDPNPDDPFRGLYLSDEVIEALLDEPRVPLRIVYPMAKII